VFGLKIEMYISAKSELFYIPTHETKH